MNANQMSILWIKLFFLSICTEIRSEYELERVKLTEPYFVYTDMRCTIRYPNDPHPETWKNCQFYQVNNPYNTYITDIRCESQSANYCHDLINTCYAISLSGQTCNAAAITFWNTWAYAGVGAMRVFYASGVPVCPSPFEPDFFTRDCRRKRVPGYGPLVSGSYYYTSGQTCGSSSDCQNIAPGAICSGGYCSCDSSAAGREKSCNYGGYCVDRSAGNGRCECWPDLPSSSTSITQHGNACELNVKTIANTGSPGIKLCRDHGIPYCRLADFAFVSDGNGREIIDPVSGTIVGYYCRNSNFGLRGLYSCLCTPYFYQTIYHSGDVLNPDALCANPVLCLPETSFEQNGACHCKNNVVLTDLHRINASSIPVAYACVSNCKNERCAGHGTCVFNQALTTIISPHSTDCSCNQDWMSYQFAGVDFSAINIEYDEAYRCNWPRNRCLPNDICGEYADPYFPSPSYTPQSDANPQCEKIDNNSPLIVALGDKTIQKNSLGIWVEVCGKTENIDCGGPRRGVCIQKPSSTCASSVHSQCVCKNGYSGAGCQNVHCPLVYNMICAGNGMCDMATGHCVCNLGFLGKACHLWNHNTCFQGQLLHVNPGPDLIQTTLDTQRP